MASSDRRAVAYLLKGYPRISELFIASEIERLEKLGVPIRLYAVKPGGEDRVHDVVERIAAKPAYLPRTTPLSGTSFPSWLRTNVPRFRPAVLRVVRRHPLGAARAAAAALVESYRARRGRFAWRRVYAKELLLAFALVAELDRAGDVRHIHAHFAHGATTVAWLAAKMTGLTFSFTGHAKDIWQDDQNPAGLLARKMRAATFIATCTGANFDHLVATAPGANVHLVYHGLNADFSRLVDGGVASLAPPDGRPFRVVTVGRLVPKKGHDVLVRALGILARRGVDVQAVIAGEPDRQEDELRRLIAENALDERVVIRGTLTQGEILDEYRRAHCFALACRVTPDGDRDGIPNVMVEAMAAGLPVVATEVSGIPELLKDGRNGLLVAPDDPEALADALERLARDAGLRESLRDGALTTVRDDWDGDVLARTMADLLGAA